MPIKERAPIHSFNDDDDRYDETVNNWKIVSTCALALLRTREHHPVHSVHMSSAY